MPRNISNKLSLLLASLIILFLSFSQNSQAKNTSFGQSICHLEGLKCLKVKRGQSWHSLWPDKNQRDLVRRLNRMNVRLRAGTVLAVPEDLEHLTRLDISPLPYQINSNGEKEIRVDLNQMAWGAYDEAGNLVDWGPAVGGKSYCPDTGSSCRTLTGQYRIKRKGGAGCKSRKFPIPKGGAPMPYCMFYQGGFALHGSNSVPGRHASHGCVRIFPEDARWLHNQFTTTSGLEAPYLGTKVLVIPGGY